MVPSRSHDVMNELPIPAVTLLLLLAEVSILTRLYVYIERETSWPQAIRISGTDATANGQDIFDSSLLLFADAGR
ncbi:hypothetical protein Trydic_g1931 [Trypoxylus dichotomus]